MIRTILAAGVALLLISCASGEATKRPEPCPPIDVILNTPMGPIIFEKGECDTERFQKYRAKMEKMERDADLETRIEGGI